MTELDVPKELSGPRSYDEYSDLGAANKGKLHTKGRTFLKKLAERLGMEPSQYDVRSNRGGIAVSGEVTLHSDDLYVQIAESFSNKGGLSVMYRSCSSRKDYCGNQNHHVQLEAFSQSGSQGRILSEMKSLIDAERQRKRDRFAPAPAPAAPAPAPAFTQVTQAAAPPQPPTASVQQAQRAFSF